MSGIVYFIGAPGRIKVGYTQDLHARYQALCKQLSIPESQVYIILPRLRAEQKSAGKDA